MTLVCVDCHGTSSFYAQVSRQMYPGKKIRWIHVMTEETIRPNYAASFNGSKDQYQELLTCNPADPDSMQRVLERLRPMGVTRVLGGMESGAVEADKFNAWLGLPGNDPETSADRREKNAMQIALGDFAIPTLLSRDRDEILAFVKKLGTKEVVIKPNASSGAEKVEFVDASDPEAIWKVISGILDKTDNYGHLISDVVVQPAIKGPEYVVNTISVNGEVTITAIWRYEKFRLPNGRLIYFIDRPIDLQSDLAKELEPLASLVHARLGNKEGPGHAEFVKDEDTGRWYLFEQAARVGGAGMSMVDAEVWGTSHLHLYLMSILDPEGFKKTIASFPRRKIKDAAVFTLIARKPGRFRKGAEAALNGLMSLFVPAPYYGATDGKEFEQTLDLTSAPLTVNLVGTEGQVALDARALLKLETNGRLFEFFLKKGLLNKCGDLLESVRHRLNLFERFRRIRWHD